MSSFPIQSSVVLARLKPFGISMEKSLTDLIKGIRAHSKESPESLLEFLNDAVNECRDELNTTDLEVKATAILKLTYLEMYGFDMSWCNFHILEVMSSARFQQKRIGYLAAIQSLKSEPELLILATNQFKKDLNSHNHVEVGLALSGIATIVSPALAKDILDDVVTKLSHSKPYIRKKAILALFKVFLQYPESLRSTLPRVIEKLDDSDTAVVSSTITIICEISKKNPSIFVSYLPKFFHILEETSNNWLIIRILKLFQSLLKIEPRMKKRIMPSILNLLVKTEASSLIYECINCIVNGGMISGGSSKDKEVAKICIDHLMKFFDTRDSNLKFVGLIALIKILEIFPSYIHKVKGVSSIVMDCLTDGDMIIKRKALEICHYLASEENMASLIKTLLLQLVPETPLAVIQDSLKLEITKKLLEIASTDNYSNIPNFKWYVTALKELVNLTLLADTNRFNKSGAVSLPKNILTTIAVMIGREFKAVCTKVPSIRSFFLKKVVFEYTNMVLPLEACPLLMSDIYWILGEYINEFGNSNDDEDEPDQVSLGQKVVMFNNLVNCYIDESLDMGVNFKVSKTIIGLQEPETLTVLIDALVKLFNGIVSDYKVLYLNQHTIPYEKLCEIGFFLTKLVAFLEHWQHHTNFEVQERCLSWLEFLKLCLDALDLKGGIDMVRNSELEYYKKKFRSQKVVEIASENSSVRGEESDESNLNDSSDNDSEQSNDEDGDVEIEEDKIETDSHGISNPNDLTTSHDPRALPSILSEILPSFFTAYQINPIADTAQSHVLTPEDLLLDSQINNVPQHCFEDSSIESDEESLSEESSRDTSKEATPDVSAQRDRQERLKDDPYYIFNGVKKKSIKAKPRVLNLEDDSAHTKSVSPTDLGSLNYFDESAAKSQKKSKKLKKEKVVILLEETIGSEFGNELAEQQEDKNKKKKRKNKLIIDSFGLENLDINAPETFDDGKDYEYEVDLEAIRQNLEAKSKKIAKKAKDKKKSSKKDASEKTNKLKSISAEVYSKPESESAHTENIKDSEPKKQSEEGGAKCIEPVVAAKSKTKKKKKAIIED